MSTTTVATPPRTAGQRSSLAASARFGTFAVAFTTAVPPVYLICLFLNLPLFSYHPAVNRFALGWEPARSGEGPVMYWYGWVLSTLIVATVIGLLAMMLPESVARRIPLFLVWLLPILAIPFVVYSLMPFWTHP